MPRFPVIFRKTQREPVRARFAYGVGDQLPYFLQRILLRNRHVIGGLLKILRRYECSRFTSLAAWLAIGLHTAQRRAVRRVVIGHAYTQEPRFAVNGKCIPLGRTGHFLHLLRNTGKIHAVRTRINVKQSRALSRRADYNSGKPIAAPQIDLRIGRVKCGSPAGGGISICDTDGRFPVFIGVDRLVERQIDA